MAFKPIPRARKAVSSIGNARTEALRWLKEKFAESHPDEVFDPSQEPIIAPMLKRVEGGLNLVLESLRAYDHDDAREFMELYDSASARNKAKLKLEEIAFASGIGSLRLAEIAQTALILHSGMRSRMLLAAGLPGVVETMLKQAVKPKGLADREWALRSGGILPTPKGQQISIPINVNSEREPEQLEATYLDPEQRLKAIHDAVEQRRLPAPKSEPLSIGGKIDHLQAETVEIIEDRQNVQPA